MTTCRKEGKDIIIFATAEDHSKPSEIDLPDPEPQYGALLPNGEINWSCPCLRGMATGPCGVEFREAFSCFHKSEAELKGIECSDIIKEMNLCMAEYPDLYGKYDMDDKDIDIDIDEKGNVQGDGADKKVETKSQGSIGDQSKEVKGRDSVSSNTAPKIKESPENSNKSEVVKVNT